MYSRLYNLILATDANTCFVELRNPRLFDISSKTLDVKQAPILWSKYVSLETELRVPSDHPPSPNYSMGNNISQNGRAGSYSSNSWGIFLNWLNVLTSAATRFAVSKDVYVLQLDADVVVGRISGVL